eukprot:4763823-Prymnesium_polylepis.1
MPVEHLGHAVVAGRLVPARLLKCDAFLRSNRLHLLFRRRGRERRRQLRDFILPLMAGVAQSGLRSRREAAENLLRILPSPDDRVVPITQRAQLIVEAEGRRWAGWRRTARSRGRPEET